MKSSSSLLCALSSPKIAGLIAMATQRVIYAAPGIQTQPAVALVKFKGDLLPVEVVVSLDFDERTLRMGYGVLEAIERLREAGIKITHSPGLRCGILIVDQRGWIFTPVAHYLEDEPQSDETPNAIELSSEQVEQYALRFSPAAKEAAIELAETPEAVQAIMDLPCELGIETVNEDHFNEVKKVIEEAPPVKFDVVKQVRVFEPYLQYVEMKLQGAALQRRRVAIPRSIQSLGTGKELDGLHTTFDLISASNELSSKKIENELKELKKMTPSLGPGHGRVVMKGAKPHLEKRLKQLRQKLKDHQDEVTKKLEGALTKSRDQVVEYYKPIVQENPPDELYGQGFTGKVTEEIVVSWLTKEIVDAFPKAEDLVEGMKLEVTYKDVTFETLNQNEFFDQLKKAYPHQNWDRAYQEFRAAGEKQPGEGKV